MSEKFEINYSPRIVSEPVSQYFPDETYLIQEDQPFQEAVAELMSISIKLIELMPDPSLGPNERLERLSRAIPASQMQSEHRKSARNKLKVLKRRLNELVPELEDNSDAQITFLTDKIHRLIPGDVPFVNKLERMGDHRSSDIGVSPRQWF